MEYVYKGVQPSLVLPRVGVIDNESYVALRHCSPRLINLLFSAILLGNTFEGSFDMVIEIILDCITITL